MPIDAHPTATRSTCERFWFALIVLARTTSLPTPWYQHGRRVHPGDKGKSDHADPQPASNSLPRYRAPAGDIPDGVGVFFRRVAQIRHAGCRLTSAPHSNAAANPLVGRQRRAADGDRDRGALEGLFNPRCRVCWRTATFCCSAACRRRTRPLPVLSCNFQALLTAARPRAAWPVRRARPGPPSRWRGA